MMTPEQLLAKIETALENPTPAHGLELVGAIAAHAQATAAVLAARSQQTLALIAVMNSPTPISQDEGLAIMERIRANCGLLPTTDTEGSDR